ncbi:general stress protein [Bremerella cremea]|uniref:general stress protein n=1 Tax=Bremerella cremea TaxID=1031537 RepID=UPI0031F0A083
MSNQCVVAIYDDFTVAQEAIHTLDQSKFPSEQVSLVANSVHQDLPTTENLQYGDESERDAVMGAGVGGLVGFFMAAPLLTIPGFGLMLIGGPLAVGITGAIVGGLLGSMMGWGVHEDHVAEYENAVREGSFLVVANGDPFEVDYAKQILDETPAKSVTMHAQDSADSVQP